MITNPLFMALILLSVWLIYVNTAKETRTIGEYDETKLTKSLTPYDFGCVATRPDEKLAAGFCGPSGQAFGCVATGPDGKPLMIDVKPGEDIFIPAGSTLTGECFKNVENTKVKDIVE